MEHEERFGLAAIHQPMTDVGRYEKPVAGTDLLLDAVQQSHNGSADDVDEFLGVWVVVFADLIARSDRRHAHESRRRTDGFGTEQHAKRSTAPGVDRTIGERCNTRLCRSHISSGDWGSNHTAPQPWRQWRRARDTAQKNTGSRYAPNTDSSAARIS